MGMIQVPERLLFSNCEHSSEFTKSARGRCKGFMRTALDDASEIRENTGGRSYGITVRYSTVQDLKVVYCVSYCTFLAAQLYVSYWVLYRNTGMILSTMHFTVQYWFINCRYSSIQYSTAGTVSYYSSRIFLVRTVLYDTILRISFQNWAVL